MANITKTLSGSDTFQSFSHTLFDWVGQELLNSNKEETLVGFEIVGNTILSGDGAVSVIPNGDASLVFKGVFEDQSEFEAAHNPLVNGIAYYDKTTETGRKYIDGLYYDIDYGTAIFSSLYSGTYGAGVFPNTTVAWKNICTQETFQSIGWPPPNDPMTQFIYSIDIDPGTFESRDISIRYDVRIDDSTNPLDIVVEYRSDVYTYTKSIQNTMSNKVSSALKDHFAQFGPMDYTTCELLPDKIAIPTDASALEVSSILKEITSGVKSVFPISTVEGTYASTETTISRSYSPSNSEWSTNYSEELVMDTLITSDSSSDWALRVGKGGQIYSLKTDSLGETVPPQFRSDDSAPWVDEVWQPVSVYDYYPNAKFNHGSGIYIKDPILTEPFYTPRLATEIDETDRSFYAINWMQPSGASEYNEDNPSHIINLTKYKDLGDGVIEVTMGMYNFGSTEVYRYHNMPWGGVRRTALEYNYLSNTNQTSYTQVTGFFGESGAGSARLVNTEDTGGWTTFCSENSGDYGHSLGFVFGKDDQLTNTYQKNRVRQGYAWPLSPQASETDWRNYMVSTLNVRHNINQGEGIWTRNYMVFGETRTDVQNKIANRNLVDNTLFEDMNITEDSVEVIGYEIGTYNGEFAIVKGESPVFYLYSAPVSGSIPIFEMVKADGERFVTHNPYTIGTHKMYDKSVVSEIIMLGFAMRTDDTGLSLDTIFSQHSENYVADGELISGVNGVTI
tara:strand:- start:306 stop:2501 length:2196 start_codon:yes stop_codon:yes gene_type:complete